MLTFFFILVFIAEFKLAWDLVAAIRKFDSKVCGINEQISIYRPQVSDLFTSVRISVNTALLNINKAKIKLAEKKNKYKFILLKYIITTALFLTLNIKGKQAMTVVELAFSAKDFTKSVIKLFNNIKK